jgi:hypothetical protein
METRPKCLKWVGSGVAISLPAELMHQTVGGVFEEAQGVVGLEGGVELFALGTTLAGLVPAQEVEGEAAQPAEVGLGVAVVHLALVLAEDHVQRPVQLASTAQWPRTARAKVATSAGRLLR